MGWPMNTGMSSPGPRLCLSREEFDDSVLNYCINLSNSLKFIHAQVKAALPVPLQGLLCSLQPGDWVVVKDFKRQNWMKSYLTRKFQVLQVTNSAVKVAEKATWMYSSHCRKAPALEDYRPVAEDAIEDGEQQEQLLV